MLQQIYTIKQGLGMAKCSTVSYFSKNLGCVVLYFMSCSMLLADETFNLESLLKLGMTKAEAESLKLTPSYIETALNLGLTGEQLRLLQNENSDDKTENLDSAPMLASREVLHINSFYLGMPNDQVITNVKKVNAEGIDIIGVATQEGGHRIYHSGSFKSSRRFNIWLDGDSDRVVRVVRTKKFDIQASWPQIRQQIVDIYGEPEMASKADSYWDFCYGDCQVAILDSNEKNRLEEDEKYLEELLTMYAGKELSPSAARLIRTYERTIARGKNQLAIRENGSGLRIYFFQRDDSAVLNFDLVNWPWVEERGLKVREAQEREVEDEISGKSNIH